MTEQLTLKAGRPEPKVCTNCQNTESLLAKAHDELVGAHETMKAQGKELGRLRRELSNEETPEAQAVRRVLDTWGESHQGANTDPTGSRAKVVRGAMRLGHTAPMLACPVHGDDGKRMKGVPKDAVCTIPDELIEALEGLLLMPFAGPRGRCAAPGQGDRRYDDIRYALTDRQSGAPSEATIEQFRGYARWAKMSSSERLFVAYQRTAQVNDEYAQRLLDALAREGGQKDLAVVVDIKTARRAA